MADYKLFLDDYREPSFLRIPITSPGDWVVVRSVDEAEKVVKDLGCPTFISFDHDLADEHYAGAVDEATGLTFAQWFCRWANQDPDWLHPEFSYYVHSMNPVGAARIKSYMMENL